MSDVLRFVHISDTHFGPTRDFELYGRNSYANAVRIVDAINALPFPLHFVVHTGDVTSHPLETSYALAAEVLSRLPVPAYYVTGNHDASCLIRRFLTMGEKSDFSPGENLLSYWFEMHGYRCIALDGRGPDEIDPHGVLGLHQFDFLKAQLDRDAKPVVVFMHFPPLPLDAEWFDDEMLLLNGALLHEMLVPHRERVRGVFFRHVHRGMQIVKDGILYSSVASTGVQFHAWPDDTKVRLDHDHPPCFNFVTLTADQIIIKEHSVPQHP